MAYRELIFTVVAEIAEPLGDALLELGALSVTAVSYTHLTLPTIYSV